MLDHWFTRPLDRRAPSGGLAGVDGGFRRGGEFEPFYVPRPMMPQLDEAVYPDLAKFCSQNGVVIRMCRRAPHELKFHQRVVFDKGRGPMDAATEAKPVLTSADGYILDGNHRAAKHALDGTPVECIELELEFEGAIAFLFSFPQTYAYGDGQTHPESH